MLDEADLLFSYGYEEDLRALSSYVCGVYVCVLKWMVCVCVCVCVWRGDGVGVMVWWMGDGVVGECWMS